jgi:hypothetical protein
MVCEITVVSPKDLMILANNLNDLNVSERLGYVGSWPIIAVTSVSPEDLGA